MTWEEAKNRIWADTPTPKGWTENIWTEDMYERAAELYKQHAANSAVNEAKDRLGDYLVYNRGESGITLDSILDAIPLPYPEES